MHMILTRKPEGKTSLGRPRCRWVDNIKMYLRQDGVVWAGLIWLRIRLVEASCKHGNEVSGSVQF
jgi:hypothetical protein